MKIPQNLAMKEVVLMPTPNYYSKMEVKREQRCYKAKTVFEHADTLE